jgi:hypothetical protein
MVISVLQEATKRGGEPRFVWGKVGSDGRGYAAETVSVKKLGVVRGVITVLPFHALVG